MKSLNLILFSIVLSQSFVFSQGCLPEGITLSTQEQINNFQNNYPGCTEIEGDVQITSGDISSLMGLNMLTSIGGELRIFFNSNLQNLEGLNNLNYVGGLIEIWANENLTSLSGLNGLAEIGGSLMIDNYPLLSLEGLESLTTIGGILRIKSNYFLENMEGLNGLTTIGTGIDMESNENLVNLSGLNSLTNVGGDVDIIYNSSLQNFIGLENLSDIDGVLMISYNPSLNNVTALNNLTSIGGTLWITDNPNLIHLEGIENIAHNSITDLNIYNNALLNDCDVQSICDYLASPNGTIAIHDNAPGCDSPEEVEAACFNSISENTSNYEITISPNPAANFVTINVKGGIPIEKVIFCNQLGQRIREEKVLNNKIDISKLKPGIYSLEVITGDNRARTKLVVK